MNVAKFVFEVTLVIAWLGVFFIFAAFIDRFKGP